MRYLNPKADLTFKRVFGEHPDLVMSLLNALLPLTPEQEITEIEYLTPELMPDNPLRKYSIVDVRCKDKLGRQFLVEMQMIWSPEFKQRVLFNASKAYARQIGIGDHYELLQPVYSLNIVNDIFEPELKGFYHHYKIVHVEHSDKIIDGLQLIFVELPKFSPHTFSEKKMQVLWLRYLTEIDEKTREVAPELLENPQVKKAVTALEESAFTEAQLMGYEWFWDMVSVEKTLNSSFERRGMAKGMEKGMEKGLAEGLEKGLEKGLAEGLEKGLEKGLAEGLEIGKAEGLEKGLEIGKAEGLAEGIHLVVLNMKKQGIATATIAQYTGLSMEEIEALSLLGK